MVETVLDTLHDIMRDTIHHWLAQIAFDDIPTKRERQASLFEPPDTQIHHLVQAHLPVRELPFMDQKTGIVVSFPNFIKNPVERHYRVPDIRLEESQRKERRCKRAWNCDSHIDEIFRPHGGPGNDNGAVILSHTGTAGQKSVLIRHVRIGVKRNGRYLVFTLHGLTI